VAALVAALVTAFVMAFLAALVTAFVMALVFLSIPLFVLSRFVSVSFVSVPLVSVGILPDSTDSLLPRFLVPNMWKQIARLHLFPINRTAITIFYIFFPFYILSLIFFH
jgi:hypothetical protein